jgi:uncharacterized protein YuzE
MDPRVWSTRSDLVLDQSHRLVLAGSVMHVRYDPAADVLMLLIRDDAPTDAVEEPGGVIISYAEDGEPVSVELLNAAKRQLVQPGSVSITVRSGQ